MGERLTLFHPADDQDVYWADYWRSFDFESLGSTSGFSSLGELGPTFARYLRKGESILEAGCGAGRIVAALLAEGFEVSGIERSEEVVAAVRQGAPFLDVSRGDVERLPLEDSSVGAYVSLGVVEHLEGGPRVALQEAARVLKPGGRAFVSVPYLNPLRARHLRALEQAPPTALTFHQFYFSVEQLNAQLEAAGLVVEDHLPYAVEGFMVREHPLFSRFWGSVACRERIKQGWRKWFRHAPASVRSRFAHMIMAVATKA